MSPFDDDSRWTLMSSRFETPQFIRDGLDAMMADFVASLPPDDPAATLWRLLPKYPKAG